MDTIDILRYIIIAGGYMTTRYEYLVNELNTELKNKGFGKKRYKKFFGLINRQEYDKLRGIIDEYLINNLIDDIVNEREIIASNIANILNSLELLNDLLIIFNQDPQPSLTKARKLFKKKVFINIYDLAEGIYGMRTTKHLLIRDMRTNPDRCFPLGVAKRYPVLKCFLWKIF
jgi:hypothetical protein